MEALIANPREDIHRLEAMPPSFGKSWEKGDDPTLAKKVKDAIRPPAPLKPRMEAASKQVKSQIQKLEQENRRLGERDKAIFKKVVDCYAQHDTEHANIYAGELAEIRKMAKMTLNAQTALDQIVVRMETATELGDLTNSLVPVIGVMRDVRTGLNQINPQISKELGDIGNILSGVVMDVGATTGMTLNFEATNEDAQRIVEEAAAIAETKMKNTFPELPGKLALK